MLSAAVVAVALQPEALVAVSVYTPPDKPVAVNDGLCKADVYPPGPAHEYVAAPVAFPVSVTVEPAQTGLGATDAVTPVGAVQ